MKNTKKLIVSAVALAVLSAPYVAFAGSKTVTINTKYWTSSSQGNVVVKTTSGRSLYSRNLRGGSKSSFTYSWSGISAENIVIYVNGCGGVEYSMSTSNQEVSPSYCSR